MSVVIAGVKVNIEQMNLSTKTANFIADLLKEKAEKRKKKQMGESVVNDISGTGKTVDLYATVEHRHIADPYRSSIKTFHSNEAMMDYSLKLGEYILLVCDHCATDLGLAKKVASNIKVKNEKIKCPYCGEKLIPPDVLKVEWFPNPDQKAINFGEHLIDLQEAIEEVWMKERIDSIEHVLYLSAL